MNDEIHKYKKINMFIEKIDAIIENVDEFIHYYFQIRKI